MKGRIKIGADIYHGIRSFKWPDCLIEIKDPDMEFDVIWMGNDNYWMCSAKGLGMSGYFGCGSIIIEDRNSVVVLDNECEHDKGPWTVSEDGRSIYSDDFTHDVTLKVTGDFASDEQRTRYSENLAKKLNR